MRIAFTGAGGTGKSSLALALAEATGLEFMKSPSRACFEKHGVLTEDAQNQMTKEERFALQMDIFKAIDDQVFSTKEGIFDRTHLDNLFYAIWQCRELVSNFHFKQMWGRTLEGLSTFDMVFFCPLFPWQAPSDGMRTQHLPARMIMDAFIHRSLEAWRNDSRFDFWTVPNVNVEMRVNMIKRRMEMMP